MSEKEREGPWGLGRVRGRESYKNLEGVGLRETICLSLLTGIYCRDWDTGARPLVLAGTNRQFPGSLELSQAGTLRGLGSSQGRGLELFEPIPGFVHVLMDQG